MSSIIYLEPNKRNRLARKWKEQIIEMANKLEKLKQEAEKLGTFKLKEDIEYELKSLKKEFDIIFSGGSNDEIIHLMDIKYWNEKKVDERLKTIDEVINKLDLELEEKLFEKEILKKRIPALKEKVTEYAFLQPLKNELDNINNLTLKEIRNKLDKIENEINSKINLYKKIQNTKLSLNKTINSLREHIKQYSFLEEFDEELNNLEKKLYEIKDLDIDKLNKLIKEFNGVKENIENKEHKILHSIEAIKEYKIIEEEVREIDNIINNLNIKNKTKEIEKEKIQKKYDEFLEKLEFFSPKEAERIKTLNIALEYKLEELKRTYQHEKIRYLMATNLNNIKEKYKDDLEFIKEFSNKIEEVIKNNDEKEFYNLLYDIEDYNSRKKILKEQIFLLKEKLEKLGYKFQDEIKIRNVGYINTDDKKLKIEYIFDENKINFTFIRVDGNNLSFDEEQKTLNKAKKWCKDFDKLNEELKTEGIELFDENDLATIHRQEPKTIKDIVFVDLDQEHEEEYEENINISQERYVEENENG